MTRFLLFCRRATAIIASNFLLLEDSSYLLLESGDKIILE